MTDFKIDEAHLDELVSSLSLLKLPVRTVLTAYYGVIDSLFHGSRFDNSQGPRIKAGEALVARLSYLVPHLLKCPFEPIGASAENALSVMTVATFSELQYLTAYSHFCETTGKR